MLFTKMHGLGNSFVLFNLLNNETEMESQDFHKLSQNVCDVHFGIGADGIILICPSDKADFKMRVFNQDGSEAKNCGNGLRCMAKYLYDHKHSKTPCFTIETLGGIVSVEAEANDKHAADYVTVDMGKPKLVKKLIPMTGEPYARAVNEAYMFGEAKHHLTCVSMGNPHAILFVDDVEAFPLEETGPVIEHSALFPDRVNVGIVHVKNSQEIEYRVWERGAGLTMACGTGACASVVAGTLNGLLDKYMPVTVHLRGGDLTITWDDQNKVWKKGEAAYICHGEYKGMI